MAAVARAPLLVRRGLYAFERNFAYRTSWLAFGNGFFEPLSYLVSFGLVLGRYIGDVPGPAGQPISYAAFVAPALLGGTAANAAVYGVTGMFSKLRFGKVYDAMLAAPLTPGDVALGETAYAVFRGLLYAVAFLMTIVALGYVGPAGAGPALAACALIALAFAGAGLAVTTCFRSFQDSTLVNAVVFASFLFSGTLYPVSIYPAPLRLLVMLSPHYHANELLRAILLGHTGLPDLVHVAYLAAIAAAGFRVAWPRVRAMLLGGR
jgi:lipooligosaccharide transport system permease protein